MKNLRAIFVIALSFVFVLLLSWCAKKTDTNVQDEVVVTWSVESTWAIVEEVADETTTDEVVSDSTLQLNTETSVLNWTWSRVLYSYHGRAFFKQWTLEIKDGDPIGWEFILDMTNFTLEEGKEALRNHLMSADFFDVATYPESKLVITNAEKVTDNQYNITADLTIKDVTNPITFVADFTSDLKSAKWSFEIDRTLRGIQYWSDNFFDNLGDKAIKNEIQFSVEVVFN